MTDTTAGYVVRIATKDRDNQGRPIVHTEYRIVEAPFWTSDKSKAYRYQLKASAELVAERVRSKHKTLSFQPTVVSVEWVGG